MEYAMTNAGHGNMKSTERYFHKTIDDYHMQGYTEGKMKRNFQMKNLPESDHMNKKLVSKV